METKNYYVNGKKINVRVDIQAPTLGTGYESRVLFVNGKAFKIYRDYMLDKNNLGEKECLFLSKIKTNKIILPESPIYNEEKKYCGYTSKALWKGETKDLFYTSTLNFIENVKELYEDAKIMTENNVMLDDLREENIVITEDGKFYIIDPGYFVCYSLKPEQEKPKNLEEINNKFVRDVVLIVLKQLLSKKNNEYEVDDYLNNFSKNKNEFILELWEILNDYSILKEFRNSVLNELKYDRYY